MMGLSNPVHLLFLMGVLLMLFGAKRLPELGRSLGSGLAGFKDAIAGHDTPQLPAVFTHANESEHAPAAVPAAVSPLSAD